MKEDVTLDMVREWLHYDPDTGVFTWIKAKPGIRVGRVAGRNHCDGYRQICLNGHIYLAHRLAWFLFYGQWPAQMLDHINENKSDNRIANLRDVSQTKNQLNQKNAQRNSATGVRGVSPTTNGRYRAQIMLGRKQYALGTYLTVQEASVAYRAAREAFQ